MLAEWGRAVFRALPRILRALGLLLAVGMLIEFLPIDLAVVAVLLAGTHLWIGAGMIRVRMRRMFGRG